METQRTRPIVKKLARSCTATLALFLLFLICGCGGSSGTGVSTFQSSTNSSAAATTGTVVFTFSQPQIALEVSEFAARLEFRFYTATSTVPVSVQEFAFAPTILIDGLSPAVERVEITVYDSHGLPVNELSGDIEVRIGETLAADASGFTIESIVLNGLDVVPERWEFTGYADSIQLKVYGTFSNRTRIELTASNTDFLRFVAAGTVIRVDQTGLVTQFGPTGSPVTVYVLARVNDAVVFDLGLMRSASFTGSNPTGQDNIQIYFNSGDPSSSAVNPGYSVDLDDPAENTLFLFIAPPNETTTELPVDTPGITFALPGDTPAGVTLGAGNVLSVNPGVPVGTSFDLQISYNDGAGFSVSETVPFLVISGQGSPGTKLFSETFTADPFRAYYTPTGEIPRGGTRPAQLQFFNEIQELSAAPSGETNFTPVLDFPADPDITVDPVTGAATVARSATFGDEASFRVEYSIVNGEGQTEFYADTFRLRADDLAE